MERSSTTGSGPTLSAPPGDPADSLPIVSAIPSNFGKYEIVTHLASGGMADIFLCRARGIQGFEKLAIIKRVRQDRAFDKKMINLFLDEARLAASLQHPNIVQVFEFGIVEGNYFLAMEYVHGEDVHALFKRMREQKAVIPLSEMLAIVVGVCQGLHYAHECVGLNGQPLGIVHRDISPSNVLISYDGAVMITDFGIAKATVRSSETTTGTVRGKLAYMSPEQCRGLAIDRRSDIFAVGTLMHELSTGRSLFGSTSDFDVMKAIVEEPVRAPSALVAGYPAELDRIVLKALARDPAHRYATLRELQLDIERFAVENKLPISTARLAAFMQHEFADRIAGWRQRVALDHAARASSRPPSAEVEIVGVEMATAVEAPATLPQRKRLRLGLVVGVAAAASLVVVAGRQLLASHDRPAGAAGATSAHPPVAAPSPPVVAPSAPVAAPSPPVAAPSPPVAAPSPPVAAPSPPVAAPSPPVAAPLARAVVASTASTRHHRHGSHRAAAGPAPARAANKSAARAHAAASWNPEDGLPPGSAR